MLKIICRKKVYEIDKTKITKILKSLVPEIIFEKSKKDANGILYDYEIKKLMKKYKLIDNCFLNHFNKL